MVYAVSSGATQQIGNGITLAVLTSTALLAVLNIVLPQNPYDGQPLSIIVPKGATLLNVSSSSAQSVAGTLPSFASANSPIRYKYCAPMTTWYPN